MQRRNTAVFEDLSCGGGSELCTTARGRLLRSGGIYCLPMDYYVHIEMIPPLSMIAVFESSQTTVSAATTHEMEQGAFCSSRTLGANSIATF